MKVRYHVKAEEDVAQITEYYAAVWRELGADFLKELNAAIERIAADPLQFALTRSDIRCCTLHRFPYGIYYRVLHDTIEIVVVKHHKRRPGYGMRRK